MFYLSKMYTDQIHVGEGYEVLQKCIHVGVLDFNLFEFASEIAYIKKAYDRLTTISADEQKRLEYEAREKTVRGADCRCFGGNGREYCKDLRGNESVCSGL